MKYMFLGPSGFGIDKRLLDDWVVLPPCQQSDVIELITHEDVSHITIVDGYYKSIPAPWHKEILLAIEKGIMITGVGSIGALRASELNSFGVGGFGWVYEFIRDNEPTDDSIVALLHKAKEDNYEPITFAKIELLYILNKMIEPNLLTSNIYENIKKEILYVHFEKLTYKWVNDLLYRYKIKNTKVFEESNFISIKKLDVINYLISVKNSNLRNNPIRKFKTAKTPYIFRQLCTDVGTSNHTSDASDINLSLQAYTLYNHTQLYDTYNLKSQARLFMRNISFLSNNKRVVNDGLSKKIIDLISKNHVENIEIDTLNLKHYNTGDSFESLLIYLSESPIYGWLNDWNSQNLTMIINIYFHSKFTKSIGFVDLKHVDDNHKLLISTFKLCLIYNQFCKNNLIELHEYKRKSNLFDNKEYLLIQQVLDLFVLYAKSNALNYYHGALMIQKMIKSNTKLFNLYSCHIHQKNENLPYKLYSDFTNSTKRNQALNLINFRNKESIIPLIPRSSIGSHFINFSNYLGYVEAVSK